jgi:glycosyltransferase involved in cell wall biosynthesis
VQKRFPKVRFIIIGAAEEGNPDALPIESMVRKQYLSNAVLVLGRREDMREMYGVMDIMTLPSWLEGVPRVLIEASASGLPIIASDIPGNREIVQEGVTGMTVPVGDSVGLAKAILDLLNSPCKAVRMGQAGRKRAFALFDERQCFRRIVRTYEELLRDKLPQQEWRRRQRQ